MQPSKPHCWLARYSSVFEYSWVLFVMPSSQDCLVLTVSAVWTVNNWQVKTVVDIKFRNCFVQSRNAAWNHVLQMNSLFKRAFKYGYVKSVYKLEQFLQDYDDNFFTKEPVKTMRCIICFPVPSLLVITYEVLGMACRSVLSNLNYIKRHLLTEFYLMSAIDIFVVLSCIWVLILCFLSCLV